MPETNELTETVARLAAAAEALQAAAERLQGQHEEIAARLDRIVAMADESDAAARRELETRVAQLERENSDLKANDARGQRKTLSPMATALLSKNGLEGQAAIDTAVLDKALATLSVDQRIAVKAEMARAGIID
jgi:predicted RNase H-like nuclease (RuvC/YqgF family)